MMPDEALIKIAEDAKCPRADVYAVWGNLIVYAGSQKDVGSLLGYDHLQFDALMGWEELHTWRIMCFMAGREILFGEPWNLRIIEKERPKRGRPPKYIKAMTNAERQADYRRRKRNENK